MANNNTKNPNTPVPSQVDGQHIMGLPKTQNLPLTAGNTFIRSTTSVIGYKDNGQSQRPQGK